MVPYAHSSKGRGKGSEREGKGIGSLILPRRTHAAAPLGKVVFAPGNV